MMSATLCRTNELRVCNLTPLRRIISIHYIYINRASLGLQVYVLIKNNKLTKLTQKIKRT